jgi:hypothetical protein
MTKDARFPRAALIVTMRARRSQGHPTKLFVRKVLVHRAETVVASGSL